MNQLLLWRLIYVLKIIHQKQIIDFGIYTLDLNNCDYCSCNILCQQNRVRFAREDLNVIGEIIGLGIQDAMEKADANRNTMVISILAIVLGMFVLATITAFILMN